MHSAGEDGGLERVFIKRLTNTNCVAEKRSTAAYIVSYCMARFTFTTCLILPEITRISIHIVWFRGRRVGWVGGVRMSVRSKRVALLGAATVRLHAIWWTRQRDRQGSGQGGDER